MASRRLADLTSPAFAELLAQRGPVILLTIGSVEPHGPHLPLGTDTIISDAAALRAAALLEARGLPTLIAPAVPYGVTEFAQGFPGAMGISAETLTALLTEVVRGMLTAGARHVCLVNNHLEPAHDQAIRAVTPSFDSRRVSVACPLTRRHARTLSAEFKSGACHAGRYETSIVLAAQPALVREAERAGLAEVPISLSEGIKAGKHSFLDMGMTAAYAGTPALATSEHGDEQLDLLAAMIVSEVTEALEPPAP